MKKERIQCFILWLGIVGTIFYFLHVIIGSLNYPNYNLLEQAVSDLTASNAPSKEIACKFTQISGVSVVTCCILLCVFFENKVNIQFRIGIYLFTTMELISCVGYSLFPLSNSGYAGKFQDVMHVVTTVFVVVLSIASMILISIGCFKNKKYKVFGCITLCALLLMFMGSIGIGLFPEFLGLAERLSVYSVVLYCGALSIFSYLFHTLGIRVATSS